MSMTAALSPTYNDFTRVLTSYLKANEKVLKRDLSSILPGFSENQIKAFTHQAVKDHVLAHGQEGFQGAWYLKMTSAGDGQTATPERRTRAKSAKYYDLHASIPVMLREHPDGLRYLEIANYFGLNRNDAPLISVLRDLETEGTLTREEGKDATGRKVTYALASIARPKAPARTRTVTGRVTKTTVSVVSSDERDQMLEFLMNRYESVLDTISGLKDKVASQEKQITGLNDQLGTYRQAALKYEEEKKAPLPSRPLPANLRDRLSQLQQRDQELTGNPVKKEKPLHESRR